jgi:hypothetical protein
LKKLKKTIKSDLIVLYKDVIHQNKEILDTIEKNTKIQIVFFNGIVDTTCPEYWNPKYVLINFFVL